MQLLEDLSSLLESRIVLEETESNVVLAKVLVAIAIEGCGGKSGQALLLDQVLDELGVLALVVVSGEVLGQLGDIGEHEVAAFGYDWGQTGVDEELGQIVAFGSELS